VDNQHIFKNIKNSSDYIKEDQRSKHVYLKPDLLYSPSKVEKIKKLKEIFLEFDDDNSSNFLKLNTVFKLKLSVVHIIFLLIWIFPLTLLIFIYI